jgi:hypothetical protein
MGGGFGRERFPSLGEDSFEDSRRLADRLGGFDGLAKVADGAVPPATADDNTETSCVDSVDLDEESAIKQPRLAFNEGGGEYLETMGRKERAAEATRYVDILAEWFRQCCEDHRLGKESSWFCRPSMWPKRGESRWRRREGTGQESKEND